MSLLDILNYCKEGEGEIVGSKKLWQRKKNGYMKANIAWSTSYNVKRDN
jgi:hypothetical protein